MRLRSLYQPVNSLNSREQYLPHPYIDTDGINSETHKKYPSNHGLNVYTADISPVYDAVIDAVWHVATQAVRRLRKRRRQSRAKKK